MAAVRHLEFLKIIFGHVAAIGFNIYCGPMVYQIWSKSDDFLLRHGVITIFKMAAVAHLGFVVTSQYCKGNTFSMCKYCPKISC